MMKLTRSKPQKMDDERAAALALQGLTFLAGDEQRLSRFLALTGMGPGELRDAAGSSGFQAAVLDYLLRDESLLLVFAAEIGVAPELVGQAHALLGGATGDEWV